MIRKLFSIFLNHKSEARILPVVEKLSNQVIDYSSKIQEASNFAIVGNDARALTREILAGLHEQIINYHRAIFCLSQSGWAHTTGPLIRSEIEILISQIVMGKDDSDCDYRAFVYTVFDNCRDSIEDKNGEMFRSQLKNIRDNLLPLLNTEDRKRAEIFLNRDKFDQYWYSEWYKGPRKVIKLEAPELVDFYEMFGSAAHGGLLGFKFFDEHSTKRNINSRNNPYHSNMAIVFSLRFLIEFSRVRCIIEKLEFELDGAFLQEALISLRNEVELLK